ncbi:DUF4386 family protein [Nakamurella sp. YIM 132087]|uniref:DUF4386 family protein n=1 Tax=Nakamurella alba TaxID=2665158 RepID=A0A7K1FRJ6_9ACTN|nr:DUF4386 domain-containing protein [Nakamurella alba]MTD15424.1 DUF4386 family protein [Nakamurella alba]
MPDQRAARIAGGLYLLTFLTSIPAYALKAPVLSGSSGGSASLAALLELLLAAACVGSAVVLLPVLRRWSEPAAVGFVVSRTVEATLILLGVVALLTIAAAPTARDILTPLHDQAFLLGPGLIPAINALCLTPVLLRARLVPRWIPLLGLIGAPLLLVSATVTLSGGFGQSSAPAAVLALPIAAWELLLGIRLLWRGFDRAAIPEVSLTGSAR